MIVQAAGFACRQASMERLIRDKKPVTDGNGVVSDDESDDAMMTPAKKRRRKRTGVSTPSPVTESLGSTMEKIWAHDAKKNENLMKYLAETRKEDMIERRIDREERRRIHEAKMQMAKDEAEERRRTSELKMQMAKEAAEDRRRAADMQAEQIKLLVKLALDRK